MSVTSDLLFAYLREIFYATPDAKLDIEKLDEDYVMLARGLMYFALCFSQYNDFAKALAKGDLSVPLPPSDNELASPLKSLHASLKHLTWQSQQVAKGDYKQRVDFLGEFADGFNTMVKQLDERQRKLEDEINVNRDRANALEQSNLLLSNLTQNSSRQIFVVNTMTSDVLFINDAAKHEIESDREYVRRLLDGLPDNEKMKDSHTFEIQLCRDGQERYLAINTYQIEWSNTNAIALVVNDISKDKKQLKELEDQAYRDSMTSVFNRLYGMFSLNELLDMNTAFALIFIDMDNLKCVNDVYGHRTGDEYILRVARHLQNFSRDTIVCRLGGDEFMLLVPNTDEATAASRMAEICFAIEHDEYLQDKDYGYSISFGIVAVDKNNQMPASDILSLADEKMYENKRSRKKERKSAAKKLEDLFERGSE